MPHDGYAQQWTKRAGYQHDPVDIDLTVTAAARFRYLRARCWSCVRRWRSMAFPVIHRVQMRGRSNGFGFTFVDAEEPAGLPRRPRGIASPVPILTAVGRVDPRL